MMPRTPMINSLKPVQFWEIVSAQTRYLANIFGFIDERNIAIFKRSNLGEL